MRTDPSYGYPPARDPKIDSENEDLRSVIDDLTIENKRLRQLLREHQQQHNPLLDRDKIFEVRTCGLSSDKKRELEAILQKFASSIGDVCQGPSQSPENDSALNAGPSPNGTTQDRAHYPHTDSAYTSMSNSGVTSMGKTKNGKGEIKRMQGSKDTNIKSYLHDIPDSLLPKHSPIMSENSKMRLVVKRLEQLFTGKNATPGEHSQPLQQQRVSESAANADRHTSQLLNRHTRPEGAREAPILPFGSKFDSWDKQPPGSKSESEKSSDGIPASGNHSPEQRPTRPLDLDIHRGQVAEENIEYIRHLGLPTPTRQHESDQPNDGWVYLNLLINMAQLHTINVTSAFIQKSIAHLSTKFELSKDGGKIRWRGGCRSTASSDETDSNGEVMTGSSPELVREPSNSKSSKDNTISDNIASTGSSNAPATRPLTRTSSDRNHLADSTGPGLHQSKLTDKSKTGSSFDYKPIFLKDHTLLPENEFYEDSDNTASAQGFDDLTGQDLSTQANGMKHSFSAQSEEDGPIIYYKNPLFYCDMSCDKQAHQRNTTTIRLASKHILGVPSLGVGLDESPEHGLDLPRNFFDAPTEIEPLPALEFHPLSEIVESQEDSVELPASGIGGVLPDDNFMLRVKRKHHRAREDKRRVAADVRNGPRKCIIQEEIECTNRIDLPPSKLPPPSFVLFSRTSETSSGLEGDEYFSDRSDDSEEESLDEVLPPPHAFLRRFPTDSSGQHRTTDEEYVEATSYPSMDLQDPLDIADHDGDAENVNDFDRAALLERPLGIITGSLAATVGAGSAASEASAASNHSLFV
jgi:Frequency clock protein